MRPLIDTALRCAALVALVQTASAQFLITINDTRDLADTDLTDGQIDADSALAGEQRTLRAAIEQACSWGGAYHISLPAQALVLTRFGADDACHWGDLDLFSSLSAPLTAMTIEGAPGLSVLDASGFGTSPATADRIFDVRPSVPSNAVLKLKNLRVQLGLRPGASFSGGGIQHASAALLELENVEVLSCSSGNGGGIYAGGPLKMSGGSISQCTSSIDGGGLFIAGGRSAQLDGVTVLDNLAVQYGGGVFVSATGSFTANACSVWSNDAIEGGGVRSRGTLTLTACQLVSNVANGGSGSGGNISLRDAQNPLAPSTLSMSDCTVGGGSAGSGAGLHVGTNTSAGVIRTTFELNFSSTLGGGLSNQGFTVVSDSTFNDNQAVSGGGIHNFRQLAMRNCTISRNRATTQGGGLNLSGLASDRCKLEACTIAFNEAQSGGGVYLDGQFGAPVCEIKNSFLADNRSTTTGTWQNAAGTYAFTSHNYNVDTDGTCAFGPGNHAGTIAFPLYAGLGPLQFSGGATRTHELLFCSAAHCRADLFQMDGTGNNFDQRGVQRGTPRDAGAFDAPVMTLGAYCTAGTTSNGCVPSISATGMFVYSGPCNLAIDVSDIEGQKQGVIFYGISGPTALPWAPGSSSWLCVKAPTQRTTAQSSGGLAGACNGSFHLDFGGWYAAHPSALGAPFLGGSLWAQAWFRDPPAPKTTNLSNALEIPICP